LSRPAGGRILKAIVIARIVRRLCEFLRGARQGLARPLQHARL